MVIVVALRALSCCPLNYKALPQDGDGEVDGGGFEESGVFV